MKKKGNKKHQNRGKREQPQHREKRTYIGNLKKTRKKYIFPKMTKITEK